MQKSKKAYFISDLHLGVPDKKSSRLRESKVVEFLEMASKDASDIFLLGDIFDMWFEYKTVVPKGFVRLLGKLAELTDSGIKVHMFTGNHDMWMFGYFEDELNIKVYKEQMDFIIQNKKFHIGHGDGLGPGDWSYKFLKKIFKSKISQRLFAFAHPDLGLSIANYFSKRSRLSSGSYETEHHHESKEYLIQYVKSHAKNSDVDFYVFGHRHIPLKLPLENDNAIYINLGEWVHYYSYAVFDGNQIELKKFE